MHMDKWITDAVGIKLIWRCLEFQLHVTSEAHPVNDLKTAIVTGPKEMKNYFSFELTCI